MKYPARFLEMIQARAARVAIGASATRGAGAPGVVSAAREHLRLVSLSPFGRSRRPTFRAHLDQETQALLRALPKASRSWGLARKLLNIFLRDSLYTS